MTVANTRGSGSLPANRSLDSTAKYVKRTWMLYLMWLIPIAFFVVFRYVPMIYIWMAFSDFNIFTPLFESPFVGLQHFRHAFTQPDFMPALRNTLVLNVLDLVIGFPAPILLAILINELKFRYFKRFTQTVLYLPHFLSWIIVSGMVVQLFATNMGLVNDWLGRLGAEPIPFLTTSQNWVRTYIGLGVWKNAGWGTIIYLAAIAGINQELYEAAEVDGANRFKRVWHVTLPCLMPTIIILLILNIGGMIGIEFDRPWALRNPLVLDRADVLSTYVFRRGILTFQYSLATAVGVFQSAINVVLLVIANTVAKAVGERGIW